MKAVVASLEHQGVLGDAFAEVSCFRAELYACLTARGEALFESCDALLCTVGPVRTLVDLALAPEHRRGHGALYAGLNQGRIEVTRLRRALASMPLPRAADGRIVLAADVAPWLRPDANSCPDRTFCHTFGRGEGTGATPAGEPRSQGSGCAATAGRQHTRTPGGQRVRSNCQDLWIS
ncbi:transposase [Streptomyces mirabilis]|uniref:transposase n=1 Tax=Streptomyces mirabilis TaxID=68239 RepID=UPI0037BCF035